MAARFYCKPVNQCSIFTWIQFPFSTEFVNRFYELKNIAKSQPTEVSIILSGWHGSYAVDGDISCQKMTYTYGSHAWWSVDLGQKAVVFNVAVLSAYNEYLNPFDIHIGDNTNAFLNTICMTAASVPRSQMKNFTCPELEGRFVSIGLKSANPETVRHLLLCEVEVYGIYLSSP